jgi:hypothetical protein
MSCSESSQTEADPLPPCRARSDTVALPPSLGRFLGLDRLRISSVTPYDARCLALWKTGAGETAAEAAEGRRAVEQGTGEGRAGLLGRRGCRHALAPTFCCLSAMLRPNRHKRPQPAPSAPAAPAPRPSCTRCLAMPTHLVRTLLNFSSLFSLTLCCTRSIWSLSVSNRNKLRNPIA